MPTRPSFPDPPCRPGMVGLGLVIPPPQAAKPVTPGYNALPIQHTHAQQTRGGADIRRPKELPRSLLTKVAPSNVLTSHSGYTEPLKERDTTPCKIPLPSPHPTSFQSTPCVSQAPNLIASGQVPKPPLSASRPKLKRFVALLPNATRMPPRRASHQETIPVVPFTNRSNARGRPRPKTKVYVPSGRTTLLCSRHMQSFRGLGSSASARRSSGSSTNSSKSLSISTSSSCIGGAGLTSLPIAAPRLVRHPRVSLAGSARLTPASSVEAISVASWLELGDDISLPGDIVSSSPEPIDPSFTTIIEEDWEDDVPRACLPSDPTIERNDSSRVGKRLFRHGAIVRFTRTLKRARKAKALKKRISRKGSVMEYTDPNIERWSPQVSLFPQLAQILSTSRLVMATIESEGNASPPVGQFDHLNPDVQNVLSGLWSPRREDSPWDMRESTVSSRRPTSVVLGELTAVGRPPGDKRLAISDNRRAQDYEEEVLQMYEDISSCPSDSRSSGFCSSATSSRSGSSTSSESMW